MNKLDVNEIKAIIGEPNEESANAFSWLINKLDTKDKLLLNIYTDVKIGDATEGITLVSAQNNQGYFELHNCNKYLLFEPDEVIFLSEYEGRISSLVVSANGNLSVFSNINSEILKQDIGEIDAALLMSAMQLSIADSVLD